VLCLINFRKGTNRDELDQFYEAMNGQNALAAVTPGAFSKARKKLRHEALIKLNQQGLAVFSNHFALLRWHGFRVLAVDGSTARLPVKEDIASWFGGPSGASCPMARMSRLYDVMNKFVVDAALEPYDTGEREIAARHLYETDADDLLIYDRGYPACWLFSMHRDMQRHYCARLSVSFSKQIEDFVASGLRTQLVDMTANAEARAQCEEYNLSAAPVKVRLVRVELKSGEVEVLATSLLDSTDYPSHWFKKLYHLRWGVEEHYKREKSRLEIENFSGRSVLVVRQDFHAKVFMHNLAAMLVWVGQAIADRLYRHRRHGYQVNFADALSKMKNHLIRLLTQSTPWDQLLRLLTQFVDAVEAIRSDRSYPRNLRKIKLQGFQCNYKRTR
jgi:hypothetical protein